MTVTSTTVGKAYLGDGSTDDFTVDFEFWAKAELVVWVRTTATGALALQVLDFDYSVTGGAGEQGAIDTSIRSARVTNLETIHIFRVSVQTQGVDLTPATDVPTTAIEEALDRQALRMQETQEQATSRAITIPQTDMDIAGAFPDMALPDKAARGVTNAFLGFNSSGEPIILVSAITNVTATQFGIDWAALADSAAGLTDLSAVEDKGAATSVQIGADSVRSGIAPATFGPGFFITTDTGIEKLWYSDGSSNWIEVAIDIKHVTQANLPTSGFVADDLYVDTDSHEMLRDTGSAPLALIVSPWCRGSIGGLSTAKGLPERVDIVDGEARAILGIDTAAIGGKNITLGGSGMNKILTPTALWVAGDGNSGMAVAQATDQWYYIFLVGNAAGVADIAFDTSRTGAGIIGTGAIKTAGFAEYVKRIGAFRTNATGNGELDEWYQDESEFRWAVPVNSYSVVGVDFEDPGVDITLTHAPASMLTHMRGWWATQTPSDVGHFLETAQTSFDPSISAGARGYMLSEASDGDEEDSTVNFSLHTDASRKIHFRSNFTSGSLNLDVAVYGWYDDRKDD